MLSPKIDRSITKPISLQLQERRNWKVYVNGKLVEHVSHVVVEHPKLGCLTYGESPLGYDGWSFRETGGGGSVILPFAIVDDQLYIGVVKQRRPNQGGDVWNVPRGFLEPGEDRASGASRELAEEFGLSADVSDIFPLPGKPGNPNSAFFETWAKGEGVTFYGIAVDPGLLMRADGALQLKPGVQDNSPAARQSRLAEQIRQARFIPWEDAAQLGDLFTNAGVARLLVALRKRNNINV